MNSKSIRLVIVLALLSIAGIAITQTYWIRQAMRAEDNEFHVKVSGALQDVTNAILHYNHNSSLLVHPVVKLSNNDYVVKVNDKIDPVLLSALLKKYFLYADITDSYALRVYDCFGRKIVYENPAKLNSSRTKNIYPVFIHDNYYFQIGFPERKKDTGRIILWLFSSLILLGVLIFFGCLLYLFFRQKRLSETQRDFVSNMTHEFKTPLTSIQLAADLIRNSRDTLPEHKKLNYVTIIQNEAKKLESQVERILQVNFATKRKIELHKQASDVHQLLFKSIDKFRLLHPECKFMLNLEAADPNIYADALHVSNMFDNLIDNAIKYGGKPPVVKVKTLSHQHGMVIEFRDNGKGISKEFQHKIFANFYRIPSGNVHGVKGFGLGLYYTRLMARAHRGDINVSSAQGEGAVFTLKFPRNI